MVNGSEAQVRHAFHIARRKVILISKVLRKIAAFGSHQLPLYRQKSSLHLRPDPDKWSALWLAEETRTKMDTLISPFSFAHLHRNILLRLFVVYEITYRHSDACFTVNASINLKSSAKAVLLTQNNDDNRRMYSMEHQSTAFIKGIHSVTALETILLFGFFSFIFVFAASFCRCGCQLPTSTNIRTRP